MLKTSFSVLGVVALASGLMACVVDDDGPHHYRGGGGSTTVVTPPTSSLGGVAPVDTSTTSTSAMLVDVDSGQTMNAQPGDGVGVFVEYTAGGHWNVWWTCDTNQSGQSCDFSVSIAAATGNIANIDASALVGGVYSSPSPSSLEVQSSTTTEVKGVRFDTDAGAVITLEASLGDIKDGSFLFFVQDGKVNGGFAGKLTNPLRLEGSVP